MDKLQIKFPSQGWEQLQTARAEMLDSVAQALKKSKNNKVKVAHGKTAEAEFRKWLHDAARI
ncbi:MAG TPA: hypothetical protein VHZ76_08845 [Gammaproteobacteria bacterium]|jgi:hypothetical protein|nr:hypothetical protein [Gammaproteobacteria bacterium]